MAACFIGCIFDLNDRFACILLPWRTISNFCVLFSRIIVSDVKNVDVDMNMLVNKISSG